MQDEELNFMSSLKEAQSNTQALVGIGKGALLLGQGIINAFRLITACAGAWALCLMRWRVGVAVALWRYPLAWFILSFACLPYQYTRWYPTLVIFQNIVFVSMVLQAAIALVRFFRGSKQPIHSQDLGSPHVLLAPLWHVLFHRTKSPALWTTLIGEPLAVAALALVVYIVEQTSLPAPRDKWPISLVVLLVAFCMVVDCVLMVTRSRLEIMQITDRELEQQGLAESFEGEAAGQREREVEGFSTIPAFTIDQFASPDQSDAPTQLYEDGLSEESGIPSGASQLWTDHTLVLTEPFEPDGSPGGDKP